MVLWGHQIIPVHPEDDTNICTNFQDNPSNNFQPHGGTKSDDC